VGSALKENEENEGMELFAASNETKTIAIGIILISLYSILALLPMSGFIGAAGFNSILSFNICIAPLIGILLGPWRGFGFGAIAGVIATIISLPIGGGVYLIIPTTILSPAVAALFTGLALKRTTKIRNIKVPGPILTTLFLIIIILLYEIVRYEAWWFMLPYLLAAILTIIFQIEHYEFNPEKSYLQLIPFTFLGVMLDHSMMAMGSVYLLQLPADVFGYAIFPAMLIERAIATILGAIIGFVVLKIFGSEMEQMSIQGIQ